MTQVEWSIQVGGSGIGATDEGVRMFAKLPRFDLTSTKVTCNGLLALASMPGLKEIEIGSTPFAAKDDSLDKEALPKCKISP